MFEKILHHDLLSLTFVYITRVTVVYQKNIKEVQLKNIDIRAI